MGAILKNKIILGALVAFVLVMFIYNTFMKSPMPAENGESALSVGSDLIKLADELARAQLSQDLFLLPSYRSLTDFTANLSQEAFGRNNPFDAIGRD